MFRELILNNLFFSINIFLFLSLFASFWLHLDSWRLDKKNISYLSRAIAFLLLSIAFLITSTRLDNVFIIYAINIIKLFGVLIFLISFATSKMLKNPVENAFIYMPFTNLNDINKYLPFITPVLLILSLISLTLRSTKGLEKQLLGLLKGFIFLTISESLRVLYFLPRDNSVFNERLFSEFGVLSLVILFFQLISAIIILKWVWGYIRFRVGVQIFISTLLFTFFIFLITTFSFTYLLLRDIEGNILNNLKTDAKVALYSIERLQFEAMANAKSISLNSQLISDFEKGEKENIYSYSNSFMIDQNLSFLYVTDLSGKVIVSAEDEEINNLSLSEDPTFKSSLNKKPLATIFKKDGAVSPTIEVKASSPIINKSGKVIGTVICGFLIDNPLLDGIKELTDMEITVFGDQIRSASTINLSQEKTRYVGIPESNKIILNTVLKSGQTWIGKEKVANTNYYQAYLPLKTYNERIVGMISVAKPESIISAISKRSVQSTLFVSAGLIFISILPAYWISKYIEENTTA